MKLLLDSCVWGGNLDVFKKAGHDLSDIEKRTIVTAELFRVRIRPKE